MKKLWMILWMRCLNKSYKSFKWIPLELNLRNWKRRLQPFPYTKEEQLWMSVRWWNLHLFILMFKRLKGVRVAHFTKGGLNGSIIDTRVILQYAIKANASALILAHNHPSGNLVASDADNRITRNVKEALKCWSLLILSYWITWYLHMRRSIQL